MKYAQSTGLTHARGRRRRRSFIILIAVAVAVVLGSAYAAAYTTGLLPGSRPTALPASCSPTTTVHPNSTFVLNVYNASTSQGKAKDVARALKAQHFTTGVVSNDPYGLTITSVGQIRFGPKGAELAKQYVQPLVPSAQLAPDGRDDTSVDLVLGDAFPTIPSPSPTSAIKPAGC